MVAGESDARVLEAIIQNYGGGGRSRSSSGGGGGGGMSEKEAMEMHRKFITDAMSGLDAQRDQASGRIIDPIATAASKDKKPVYLSPEQEQALAMKRGTAAFQSFLQNYQGQSQAAGGGQRGAQPAMPRFLEDYIQSKYGGGGGTAELITPSGSGQPFGLGKDDVVRSMVDENGNPMDASKSPVLKNATAADFMAGNVGNAYRKFSNNPRDLAAMREKALLAKNSVPIGKDSLLAKSLKPSHATTIPPRASAGPAQAQTYDDVDARMLHPDLDAIHETGDYFRSLPGAAVGAARQLGNLASFLGRGNGGRGLSGMGNIPDTGASPRQSDIPRQLSRTLGIATAPNVMAPSQQLVRSLGANPGNLAASHRTIAGRGIPTTTPAINSLVQPRPTNVSPINPQIFNPVQPVPGNQDLFTQMRNYQSPATARQRIMQDVGGRVPQTQPVVPHAGPAPRRTWDSQTAYRYLHNLR